MDRLRHDIRFALRSFAKNPGFTAVVVMTLALGIGANAAIFGLLDQVMFRLLPVQDRAPAGRARRPGPVQRPRRRRSRSTLTPMSQPMFEGLRDHNTVFSGVLAHWPTAVHFSIGAQTETRRTPTSSPAPSSPCSGSFPRAGRLLGPEDDRTPGAHPVVVLGHRFFERALRRRPAGSSAAASRINGHPMTIVGVAPAGFHGVEVGGASRPLRPARHADAGPAHLAADHGDWRSRWLTVMARLKDGVSVEQATASVNVVYAQLLQEDVKTLGRSPRSERTQAASSPRS